MFQPSGAYIGPKSVDSMPAGLEAIPGDLVVLMRAARDKSVAEGRLELGVPIGDGDTPNIFNGPISLQSRFESGELEPWHVDVAERLLAEHYVPAQHGAAERCMDDRTPIGYVSDSLASWARPLGPQSPGGTIDDAIAHRIQRVVADGIGDAVTDSLLLIKDVIEVSQRPNRRFAPGGHTGAAAIGKTGCASIDEDRGKLGSYRRPEFRETIGHKTETFAALGGLTVDHRHVENVALSAAELLGPGSKYFDANTLNALDVVRKFGPDNWPHMEGVHGAFAVSFNYVHGSTLHTPALNAAIKAKTGRDIMVFGFDAWRVIEEHPPEVAATIISQTFNTLAQLVHGSLRFYTRVPR